MSNFHHFFGLCLGVALLAENIQAQIPGSIAGGTVELTVLNGNPPFLSSGVFRFLASRVDNSYRVVPLAGDGGITTGRYAYAQTDFNSAILAFDDASAGSAFSTALTFNTLNSGTYTITNPSFPGSYQSGTFVFYPELAPAIASATSRSVFIEPFVWSDATIGAVATYFTSYDGKTNLPLHDIVSGILVVSGELAPVPGFANVFECDYLQDNQVRGFGFDHGVMTLGFAQNDADTNTIPDIFQIDKAGSIDYTGTIVSDFSSGLKLFTKGTLAKAAGEQTLQGSMTLKDSSGRVVQDLAGIHLGLGYFSGTASYSRSPAANILQLKISGAFATDFVGELATYTGSTNYTIAGLDEIAIPAFTLRSTNGTQITVAAFNLQRKGMRYAADLQLNDGNPSSSWPDYRVWRLELLDTNDTDGDGVPDLSDVEVGSVQVNIAPAGAVSAGAQWQVDGGPLQNSGTVIAGLPVGNHTIGYKVAGGWIAPASQTVVIAPNQTTTVTATYTPETGSLLVSILPAGAIAAGAKWQVDGGAFQQSGAMLSGLPAGPHVIAFKPVTGWGTPASQNVSIAANFTTTAAGVYLDLPRLSVVLLPNRQIVGRFQSVGGFSYTLQASYTLGTSAQWSDVQTFAGTGAQMEVTLRASSPGRTNPTRFFRLKVN